MSEKLICLISIVLALGLFSNASAELIGHWRFDESSGNVAFDTSGNGNDSIINGAQSVPGVGGNALEFDGMDDYVETPILDVPMDGTVEAWVNTALGDVRQAVISSHNSEEFRLQLNYRPGTGGPTPGFLGLNVLYGALTAYTDVGSEMYDGSWHHVAFVWEGASPGTIRAYWDGQEKPVTYGSQNAWEGNYNRTAVHVIGREDLNNSNYFFAGQIDDVRFYDHAQSEGEVQAAMNSAGGKWPFALGPVPEDGAIYPDKTVKGLPWSFTTAEFLLVDDFESYNDIDPPDAASNRIFDKWTDGFGTTTNGALAGYDFPPYAEQSAVHGGVQSMAYLYDNANKTSEATLTLVYPRDWTEEGVTKLSLWFRGSSGNAADRMYIAIGNAVVYHDDPAATQITGWNEWAIDLTEFAGANLTNVDAITIGIGTKGSPVAGGTGTMYFDDIRLVR